MNDDDCSKPTVLSEEQANALIGGHVLNTRQWYEDQAKRWEFYSLFLRFITLVLTAATTVVAAFPIPHKASTGVEFEDWLKYAVVILSALATLASALLSQGGAERTATLREVGRVKLTAPIQKAILLFTQMPMTVEERRIEVASLIDKVAEIELEYGKNPLAAGSEKSGPNS